MCRVDYADEMVNLLTDTDVKARKPHKCGECRRDIQRGEMYHLETGIFDGKLETYRTCSHCMVCREWLVSECGGWVYGEVEEEILEHAQESLDMKLYRLSVGQRRYWQRFDKTGLMTIPIE